jgi:hypothetical protein
VLTHVVNGLCIVVAPRLGDQHTDVGRRHDLVACLVAMPRPSIRSDPAIAMKKSRR